MTDALPKPLAEMRKTLQRVKERGERDQVGVYEAAKREGVSKTTYYAYKQRVETYDKMMQPIEPGKQQIPPEYPHIKAEDLKMPEKQKHKPGTKRVNMDIPEDVFKYIEKEHEESTLSIKAINQKIVIDYVRSKMAKNERLF